MGDPVDAEAGGGQMRFPFRETMVADVGRVAQIFQRLQEGVDGEVFGGDDVAEEEATGRS